MPGRQEHPPKPMEEVIRADGRYPPAAYGFLYEGLARAVKDARGDEPGKPAQRHVSGSQLCLALRDTAIERWGQLARTVLAKWNIHSTMDFGNMVFVLVEAHFMWATEEDDIEDFHDVYDFAEAFGADGEFELAE